MEIGSSRMSAKELTTQSSIFRYLVLLTCFTSLIDGQLNAKLNSNGVYVSRDEIQNKNVSVNNGKFQIKKIYFPGSRCHGRFRSTRSGHTFQIPHLWEWWRTWVLSLVSGWDIAVICRSNSWSCLTWYATSDQIFGTEAVFKIRDILLWWDGMRIMHLLRN